jgi:hypothetical protein
MASARADNITLNATADGVLVDTINSGGLPTLDISNIDFGAAFLLNSLTINSASALAVPAELNTNTLDIAANAVGNHQLILDVTAAGLTGTGTLQSFLSEFSVTGLTTGWNVMEQTFINGVLLAATPVVTTNSASADVTSFALETNPFSAEVRYTINSVGSGQFNGGIDISAVPGPILGAGLPGMITALFGMLGLNRLRRKRSSLSVV